MIIWPIFKNLRLTKEILGIIHRNMEGWRRGGIRILIVERCQKVAEVILEKGPQDGDVSAGGNRTEMFEEKKKRG